MPENSPAPRRRRRLRILSITCLLVGGLALGGVLWVRTAAEHLVCEQQVTRSDAILVENFDPDYLVFERAAELQARGLAPKVLVPTVASNHRDRPNEISAGIVALMSRVAGLKEPEIIPFDVREPIALNAALQIRQVLRKAGVRSVIVVAPGFRSRRSSLVYAEVLGAAGIATSCVPVFGSHNAENWTGTWHGIQDVTQQYVKLLYYRLYVLPGRDAS